MEYYANNRWGVGNWAWMVFSQCLFVRGGGGGGFSYVIEEGLREGPAGKTTKRQLLLKNLGPQV